MKMKIKIPGGWRRLRRGTRVLKRDKHWCDDGLGFQSCGMGGGKVGEEYRNATIYIRRAARRGRK
jgi:hypothetical protein